jgi:hypothetical protein
MRRGACSTQIGFDGDDTLWHNERSAVACAISLIA